MQLAREMGEDKDIVMCLSGRGYKDAQSVADESNPAGAEKLLTSQSNHYHLALIHSHIYRLMGNILCIFVAAWIGHLAIR